MGLFSEIGKVISNASAAAEQAKAEAERLPTSRICDKMKTAGVVEYSGYLAELKERSHDMSDDELIDLLEKLQMQKNPRAMGGIMGEMSDRGLAEWKDGGGVIKYY